MTTQQNDNDPRVSEMYRQLTTEKTPAELDDKVLTMAASAARTRYGLTRAWIRPVAWTATIGLSLAFILEMSQLPNVPERSAQKDAPELMKVSTPPADSAPTAPAAAKREANAPAAADPAPIQPMATSEVDADDMHLLQEAEERAVFAAVMERKEQVAHCDAEARADAETWYECIEVLREEGRADAANTELEALREAFPDFSEPAPK